MAPEMALPLNTIIGVIFAFAGLGIVFVIIALWKHYWSNKDDVERYKKK